MATGCAHQTQIAYQPPPAAAPAPVARTTPHYTPGVAASTPKDEYQEPSADSYGGAKGKPVYTEVGMASWYGGYHNHRAAADGSTFDQDAMTAAHRTLPLGSTALVTNLATGQQVLVRITDRGPFVPGRMLDLSMGAAKAIGVYRTGVAKVRIEAYSRAGADPAGRWCVQTGAFKSEHEAVDLKEALLDRYRGSKVIEFSGPTGYWVRIDPATHERASAEKIADWIGPPEKGGQAYLVRTN